MRLLGTGDRDVFSKPPGRSRLHLPQESRTAGLDSCLEMTREHSSWIFDKQGTRLGGNYGSWLSRDSTSRDWSSRIAEDMRLG